MPTVREQRFYSYTFELYEESAPKNFKEILNNLHIKTAYALHDKDIYDEFDYQKYLTNNNNNSPNWKVGETKKPHYHIVLKFETLKSIKQILTMLEPLGVKYVEPVQNERGMLRYLIHFDNKEKYQYKRNDITTLCGYEISKFFRGDDDMVNIKQELRNIILKDKAEYTYNYFDFYNYVMDNFDSDYLDMIDKFSYSFQSLINGKNKKKEQEDLKRMKEQGEEDYKIRQAEITEMEKMNRLECEFQKLATRQAHYEKKEHFIKTYIKLKDKKDLDCNELKLKNDIEKFLIEYENEKDFKNLIEENNISIMGV